MWSWVISNLGFVGWVLSVLGSVRGAESAERPSGSCTVLGWKLGLVVLGLSSFRVGGLGPHADHRRDWPGSCVVLGSLELGFVVLGISEFRVGGVGSSCRSSARPARESRLRP